MHIGHLAIANYLIEFSDLEEIWFVVSPHNPLKKKSSLLADHHRLQLTELAVSDDDRFRVSDIETRLPQPSYTVDTLTYLTEKNPDRQFSLIMGGDNLHTFYKWKNAAELAKGYPFYIYPRKGEPQKYRPELEDLLVVADITLIDAPQIEISGTFIRQAIKERRNIRHFLPPGVWEYILNMHFYE